MVRRKEVLLVDSAEDLSRRIVEGTAHLRPTGITSWRRLRSLLFNQWLAKVGTLALVIIFWLLLAGQQDFEFTFSVPLQAKNLPDQTEIVAPVNPRVRIKVRGLRKDASTLNEGNVRVELDLSTARHGQRTFLITREDILLPNERIQIVSIEPAQVTFILQSKGSS